ncbi:MAG: hypothetical protein HY884_04530 [Deltaproteobacteria bacterium]|nr:hypothetical protein [Deltaproteobacteria bacterium]
MNSLAAVKTFFSLLVLCFLIAGTTDARATNLPLRGIARGESKIRVGDIAPLILKELEDANREGKVIVLMLGFPDHCPWCDRMDRYIYAMMKDTKNFNNRVFFLQKQIEHAKMIVPPPEGVRLKEAYGVQGQPWLFIIDKSGHVRFIYKVFAASEDIKENIEGLLKE